MTSAGDRSTTIQVALDVVLCRERPDVERLAASRDEG
jgi:hypothetical protein